MVSWSYFNIAGIAQLELLLLFFLSNCRYSRFLHVPIIDNFSAATAVNLPTVGKSSINIVHKSFFNTWCYGSINKATFNWFI